MMFEAWKAQSDQSFRICAFGSSNTELSLEHQGHHNWVDWLMIQLRNEIGKHVSVTNLGIGGETIVDLLNRIERDVKPMQPAMVIVTIGGNDAVQGMPMELFAERLRKICSIIHEYGAMPVLQTYYCPLYHLAPPGFEERFQALMQTKRELAMELRLPLVDQYMFFEPLYRQYPDEYAKLMRDFLHLGALGNLVMGRNIASQLGLSPFPIPKEMEEEFHPLFDLMNEIAGR